LNNMQKPQKYELYIRQLTLMYCFTYYTITVLVLLVYNLIIGTLKVWESHLSYKMVFLEIMCVIIATLIYYDI